MFIFGKDSGMVFVVINSYFRERNKGEVDVKRELMDLKRGRGNE